jgi:hypothetical protein
MLESVIFQTRDQRLQHLRDMNPHRATWLVADIEHKRLCQDFFLDTHGWLAEDACLRANELWAKIHKRMSGRQSVVSSAVMEALFLEWCHREGHETPGAKTALAYLDVFLPVFLSENGTELFHEWLSQRPQAILRWGHWFQKTFEFWTWLKDEELILERWLPAVILHRFEEEGLPPEGLWPRDLVVDLGPEVSRSELRLFEILARSHRVTILSPHSIRATLNGAPLDQNVAGRFPTELSEIKHLTAKIRDLLDSGVAPADIAVFAAEPEHHWPVLASYFSVEGIPVNKPVVAVLQSFLSVQKWLSGLRRQLDHNASEEHEQSEFILAGPDPQADGKDPRSYEKFRELLSNIYGEQDLSRWFEKTQLPAQVVGTSPLDRDQFIRWSLDSWPASEAHDPLRKILSVCLLEVRSGSVLNVGHWLMLAENLARRLEVRVEEPAAQGVSFRSFRAGYFNTESYGFVLSLSEGALVETSPVLLTPADYAAVTRDLGFELNEPLLERQKFYADWLARDQFTIRHWYFSETDFSGQPLAPSMFWLRRSLAGVEPAGYRSRWDQLQEAKTESLESWVREPLDVHWPLRLSASSLENHAVCAFKFQAEKIFRLRKEVEVDLDLDRLRRGRLLHAVLDLALDPNRTDHQGSAADLVERARASAEIIVDQVSWPFAKKQMEILVQRFLEFEAQWRSRHPQLKTVGRELGFSGELFGFPVTGKIDRVDGSSTGQYVVIDYKSSTSGLTNYDRWLESAQYQLLLYTHAIESGWTSLPKGKVVGAVYYDIKALERELGFLHRHHDGQLFTVPTRGAVLLDDETLSKLRQDFLFHLEKATSAIRTGIFPTNPMDPLLDCDVCDWRTLCRAPHL